MEAHNGLFARIDEETGFQEIWASGLSISAALGVRDNNEASWTRVLEVLEFMADATSIPILVEYIRGQWLDIDDALDLARARNPL